MNETKQQTLKRYKKMWAATQSPFVRKILEEKARALKENETNKT